MHSKKQRAVAVQRRRCGCGHHRHGRYAGAGTARQSAGAPGAVRGQERQGLRAHRKPDERPAPVLRQQLFPALCVGRRSAGGRGKGGVSGVYASGVITQADVTLSNDF